MIVWLFPSCWSWSASCWWPVWRAWWSCGVWLCPGQPYVASPHGRARGKPRPLRHLHQRMLNTHRRHTPFQLPGARLPLCQPAWHGPGPTCCPPGPEGHSLASSPPLEDSVAAPPPQSFPGLWCHTQLWIHPPSARVPPSAGCPPETKTRKLALNSNCNSKGTIWKQLFMPVWF